MASKIETIEYICDQINNCGDVRYRKMFGEYMIYLNDKPIFLVCEDTLFVKITDTTTEILRESYSQRAPYNGAKPHYDIQDVENRELMQKLATELEKTTQIRRKK